MARILALLASAALAAATFAFGQEPARTTEGRYFVVVARGLPERIAAQAIEAADAAWPHIRQVYDVPGAGFPDKPLIHLHRTVEEYENAEYALTRGRFREHLAFSSWDTWQSHVAIQPFLSDQALLEFGLPALTRQQIAHEATHIASYRVLPCYKRMPLWLSEGAACWVARRALIDLGLADEDASDPESSTDVLRARGLIRTGAMPPIRALLSGAEIEGDRLGVYAAQGLLFDYLASGALRPRTEKALAAIRRLGPNADTGQVNAAFLGSFPGRVLEEFDRGFAAFLDQRHPPWDMTYRSLEVRPDGWYQATMRNNAVVWRTDPADGRFAIEGRLRILPGKKHQLNVLLARRGERFLQVAFHATPGVTLLAHEPGTGFRTLASSTCPHIRVSADVRFLVDAAPGRLTVLVEGEPVLEAKLPDSDLSGQWGVGALAGSAGIWRGVRLVRDPAAVGEVDQTPGNGG